MERASLKQLTIEMNKNSMYRISKYLLFNIHNQVKNYHKYLRIKTKLLEISNKISQSGKCILLHTLVCKSIEICKSARGNFWYNIIYNSH